jgi:hypothetical protein
VLIVYIKLAISDEVSLSKFAEQGYSNPSRFVKFISVVFYEPQRTQRAQREEKKRERRVSQVKLGLL